MHSTTRLLALLAVSGIANAAAAAALVDLDDSGALDRLRAERPDHFDKVLRILDDAQRLPEREVTRALRVHHQADDVDFRGPLLTSDPPQRRLSFSLDAVRYREAQARAKAVTTQAKPVPPVQRPGVAPSKGAMREAELQSLSKRLDQTGNPRDAAALLRARRAMAAR